MAAAFVGLERDKSEAACMQGRGGEGRGRGRGSVSDGNAQVREMTDGQGMNGKKLLMQRGRNQPRLDIEYTDKNVTCPRRHPSGTHTHSCKLRSARDEIIISYYNSPTIH